MIDSPMQMAESRTIDQSRALLPALCCGILSAFLMRAGFLSFFFLVPLGFISAMYGSRLAWTAWAASAIATTLVAVTLFVRSGGEFWFSHVLYHATLSLGFTWIMAGGKTGRMRTAYRVIIAASAGALVLLLVLFYTGVADTFQEMVKAQAEILSSLFVSAAGPDAVRRSVMEYALTPDAVLEMISSFLVRGGAVLSCFLIFFFSRQISVSVARLIRKQKQARGLSVFYAPARTIWVLSASLCAVLLFGRLGWSFPEIIAWNLLVVCGIIFLAQGAGIVLHKLSSRSSMVRFICVMVFFVLVFSPGINAAALGFLLLLGISENWLPLRKPKETADQQ